MKLSAILIRAAVILTILAALCAAAVSCGKEDLQEKNDKTAYYDEASGITYNLYDVVKKVYDGQKEVMAEYKYAGVASYSGNGTSVVIPGKVTCSGEEYDVTLVEAMAFSNIDGGKSDIVSVTLPESVTVIFDGAFEANKSLKEVKMPGVVTISAAAFKDCTALKYGGFTLPDKIESIEARAFSGAFVLTESEAENGTGFYSLKLPDSLKKIGSDAFTGCDAISDIEIGASLNSLGSKAFADCTNIGSVTVSGDNPNMTSVDGAVYRKDMSVLMFRAPAKTGDVFEMPSSVTSILSSAMQNSKYVKKVVVSAAVTEIPDSFIAYSEQLVEVAGGAGVTSVGSLSFSGCTSLQKVGFMENIKTFSARAFSDCQSLTGITLNGSIEEIPDGCFAGCTGLLELTIPKSVKSIGINALSGCASLTSLEIPEAVQSIGSSAFSYCFALTSMTLPETVTEVPHNCFYSDFKLTKVVLEGKVTAIGDSAFKSCSVLESVEFRRSSSVSVAPNAFAYDSSLERLVGPGSSGVAVTYAGDSAFSGCGKLSLLDISSATYIGQLAFSGCTSLNSVTLGVNPGSYAFRGCTSLKSVVLGDGVTSVSDNAFVNCSELSDVTVGASLSSIGEKAFAGCESLESFSVSDKNKTFRSADGVLFSDGGKTLSFYPCGKKDAEYTVPAGTTDIADSAFSGSKFLRKVALSDDTVNLGAEAFSDCTALTDVYFGGLTAISKKAFSGCTSLREISITDEKLTKIGYGAFSNCTGLEKVTVGNNVRTMNSAATVDTISFAFVGCDFEKLTFYTPAGSYFESQLLRIGGLKIVNY